MVLLLAAKKFIPAVRVAAPTKIRIQTRAASLLHGTKVVESAPSQFNDSKGDDDIKGNIPLLPNFNDARASYESKSTPELIRAAVSFGLCKVPILVNNAELLLTTSRTLLGGAATDSLLRATLFGHFCAGENEHEIKPVLDKLDEVGIGSILDYAAESDENSTPPTQSSSTSSSSKHAGATGSNVLLGTQAREYDYESEAQCDHHVKVFQKCISDVANFGNKDGYAAIKVTALGNPKLLARMSQAIVEAKRLFEKFDTNRDGTVTREEFELGYKRFFNYTDTSIADIFEQFDSNHTGTVDYITWSMNLRPKDLPELTANCKEVGPLARATPNEEEVELIEAMFNRGRLLATHASEVGTRLLIDAEQVRFQPAIDNLVLELQQTFNAVGDTNRPVIYNTYQCYLKDAIERLRTDILRSERFDYHFGAKLVRGAYMESERADAIKAGLQSPIHDSIEDTHTAYGAAVDFLLQEIAKRNVGNRRIELMCATHNQQSIEEAIKGMELYQIDKQSSAVSFAQLYGMSDHLTFNLGRHGYRAYKYVPYGAVHEVMPYLLRRARENSAIVGGAAAEFSMILNELGGRLRFSS